MITRLLVATRSGHKLREIRQLLDPLPELELLDLNQAGVEPDPGEDEIEAFDTFRDNALAKARYFHRRTGLPTLADDSGLCVDALEGAPGVRSRRFSGRTDLSGDALDEANNRLLLERLRGVTPERRTARYVCAAALVTADGEWVVEGDAPGVVLDAPRGSGGFGYDPLVLAPSEGLTYAELSAGRKNQISHRGAAMRAVAERLRRGRSGAL